MSRRGAALLVAVAVLLVGATSPAAAYRHPDDVCASVDQTKAIAELPTGKNAAESPPLHAGSQVQIVVCGGGDATPRNSWRFSDGDSFTAIDRTEHAVYVELTGEGDLNVVEHLKDRDDVPGPTIEVSTGTTAESNFSGAISFGSERDAQAYENVEGQFLTGTMEINTTSSRLTERTTQIRGAAVGAELTGALNGTNATVTELHASTTRVERRSDRATDLLFDSALAGDADAVEAMQAVDAREARARTSARGSLQAYVTAVEQKRSAARDTVFMHLGGTLLGGLVVGSAGGWFLTRRRLDAVAYDRRLTSEATFGPRQMLVPAGLAAAVLVLTLVALVALGGLGSLLEVVL